MATTLVISSWVGCTSSPGDLAWKVTTASDLIAAAGRGFEAEIRRDTCDGALVHRDSFRDSPALPAVLPPGRYAFVVRARNAACEVIGEGCEVVDLPGAECVEVTLEEVSGGGCFDRTICDDGLCSASADAGPAADADCVSTPETCNGLDDDCNGLIDDGAADCSSVTACTYAWAAGSAYLFCPNGETWWNARMYCQSFGYDLVVIDQLAEQDYVTMTAYAVSSAEWFLGLRDVNLDGSYADDEWTSGPSSFRQWRAGHPGLVGGCALMKTRDGGEWEDKTCDNSKPFVCESR